MVKILIVDDDPDVRDLVRYELEARGWDVVEASTAAEVAPALAAGAPDLILLDLRLPDQDGLTLAARLRASSSIPIIMLTGLGGDVDRIVGLEMGADDYVVKPFNPRELVARIHAVLRRKPRTPPGAPAEDEEVVSFGRVTVNLGTRSLTRDGEEMPLTTGEFALLKVLLQHPRQPLSRDKLMELARGREYDAFDRSIDVQISRLRKLVEEEASRPRYLQTVWGFGYVFVPDGQRSS